ncbi:polyadenylation and cleavage factor homolog 4-like isoform X2 [Manihot esculenta]|uniref:Uncharacterized protein n=1 Tax=Manihot esculenta TaxID=3983 RepID=A0ACB7H3G6_MANES|nr:polyadenylation and cleavage factor homolog 4-like isoform X2 [Manihot esculenta]KAG8647107.1 hypothetical protein MANES_09G059244v8 [Manihot esculenta]
MEMENTRRSFDRSREPGLKKPRLSEEQTNIDSRHFPQSRRPATAVPATSSAARYRATSDRESGSNISSRTGAYQPQPQQYQDLVSRYKTALSELNFNSKPIISNLTIIAGENLHAAKAIAATVCANILEVPSEQKLPSLYLLDCIVKNIGRDYIKYFAARLPQVFCKVYRQVDPSVHLSMRHLFGTWKGVFPPLSLQMIEKELGFASAANGSSSGTATSKPDSQSRHRQHRIHVNPKYLEIQSLQQSGRAKGLANDLTVPITNSTEDAESLERPERVAGIGPGRLLVDPPVKIHNIQRSHRETPNEPVHEKKINAMYGDLEHTSDISRNSGSGIGRISRKVAEQGYEKPQYGAGNSVTETIVDQTNGFSMKHGFPNFSMRKAANVDLHRQPTQSVTSKSSSAVSDSWKNTEEEEFMWNMHSRLSDQDAVNLSNKSKKELWTCDDGKKMEFEYQLRKQEDAHEVVSRFGNPPAPSFPARSHQQLQNSMEQDLSRPDYKAHHLSVNVLQSNVQLGNLQKLQPEDLPSSSPSLPSFQRSCRHPILQPRQADSKRVEPSGLVSKILTPTLGSSAPGHSTPLSAEVSGESSTSGLLAAVMSSGILSNITTVGFANKSSQDNGQNPVDSKIHPPLSSGTSPSQITSSWPRVTSPSGPLSLDVTSVTSNISQRKVEQPPGSPPSYVQTSSAVNKVDDPISNLWSSLIAKGLISASKSETSSSLPPQMPTQSETKNPSITNSSNTSTSSLPVSSVIPHSSTKDEVLLHVPDAKKSVVLPQSTSAEIRTLIGLEFKSDIIRVLHPLVICSLFDDLPHQCSVCGLKLKLKERLDRHLEWHTWRKSEPDGRNKVTRRWYACSGDWVTGKTELPLRIESSVFTDELVRTMDENEPMVPADGDQCLCVLCGELFEDYYSHERKKWMFKAAMHLSLTLRDGRIGTTSENAEGPIVHVNCISESSVYDLGLASDNEMDG